MRLNTDEDIILVKELIACKAHVTALGSVQTKFQMAADTINSNPSFRFQVKGRAVQEKFNKLLNNLKI